MSMSFHVAALSGDQVPLALPLIQATWPGADLAAWGSFVAFFTERIEPKVSGVLALHDGAGHICGVFAYRVERDLRAGPTLAIQLFTAVDVVNSLRTVRALLDAADLRAHELGCAGVQIRLSNDQAGLASRLRVLGLSSQSGLFWKQVDPAQPSS
jgi:hypothetical protein